MFILMPTCDTHARIAEISAGLLERYWPGHPPLHVPHYGTKPNIAGAVLHDCGPQERSPWLATVTRFLRTVTEDSFLLLLDDYGLCGPARMDVIASAAELMRRDESIGLIPLCWYPAARRTPEADAPGFVSLTGTPVLLQAAIWRRTWFLELSDTMDPNTSPWGFEAHATQAAKRNPRRTCAADIPEPTWLGGNLVDGFVKSAWPLPYHNLMHRGRPNLQHEPFLRSQGFSFPSYGLGDTIARLARATGVDQVAKAFEKVTGRGCGCEERRQALNRTFRYGV